MNTNGRTVHQIVLEIAADATSEVIHIMNADSSFISKREELEEELKSALLQAASVKEITIVKTKEPDLHIVNKINTSTDIWEDLSDIPAGKYLLIPEDRTKWLVEKL